MEGLDDTVTVNGVPTQIVVYPIGSDRVVEHTSIGYIGELPSDYFSPQGALPVVSMYYANSPDNFGGEDGYNWYGLDPAKMEQLFLAIDGAMTQRTADDVPGILAVSSDAHVPINEINALASYRKAQEVLVTVGVLRLIPAAFPG